MRKLEGGGQKLILLTDTVFLKAFLDRVNRGGHHAHQITMPGSDSGIDEIIFECITPLTNKLKTHYTQDVLAHSDKLTHICTL